MERIFNQISKVFFISTIFFHFVSFLFQICYTIGSIRRSLAMSQPFYHKGLQFECKQCSSCCRYEEGVVIINDREVDQIADFLNLQRGDFIAKYCKRVFAHNQVQLSLIEKSNLDCIFWDPQIKGCAIYSVRPIQCSTFPFWPSLLQSHQVWQKCSKDCPGMNQGKLHSFEEILEQKHRYEKEIYGTESK